MTNELDDGSDTVRKAYASSLKNKKMRQIESPGNKTAKCVLKSHCPNVG